MGTGTAPASWQPMIAEMMVQDYPRALAFWTSLGFTPDFTRPTQMLACLSHPDGAQIMIYQRDGDWETGPMEPPFGRGAVIQVFVKDATAAAATMADQGLPFYVPLRDKWRDWGDCMGGQREFLVQDPDGYLIMVAQRLGTKPLSPA